MFNLILILRVIKIQQTRKLQEPEHVRCVYSNSTYNIPQFEPHGIIEVDWLGQVRAEIDIVRLEFLEVAFAA